MPSYRSFVYGSQSWTNASGDYYVYQDPPSGAAAGDTLIVFVWSTHGTGAPTISFDSTWQVAYDAIVGSGQPRLTIAWKAAIAGHPAQFTIQRSGVASGSAEWCYIAIQDGGAVGVVSESSLQTSSTHTAPSVNAPFVSIRSRLLSREIPWFAQVWQAVRRHTDAVVAR